MNPNKDRDKGFALRYSIAGLVLVAIAVLMYWAYAPAPKTTVSNIQEPETLTVYWNGTMMPVPDGSPFFMDIILETEKALDATKTDPEANTRPVNFFNTYDRIELVLDDDDDIRVGGVASEVAVQKIIILLEGPYYDAKSLVLVDRQGAYKPFTTDAFVLDKLYSIGDLYHALVTSRGGV